MVDKIYIVGPVGSGKTTLARRLAKEFDFICVELDSVIYQPKGGAYTGNEKRPLEEREALLSAALACERWVLEDAGRRYFKPAWQQADVILHLEPSVAVRKRRIVTRWIKQVLCIEPCGYRPGLYMLKLMFEWTKQYERDASGLKQRLAAYRSKTVIVRNETDLRQFIAEYLAA